MYGREGILVARIERLRQAYTEGESILCGGYLCVDHYVDEEQTFIKPIDVIRKLQSERLYPPIEFADSKGSIGKKLLFVSGPEGFVNHWVGAKQSPNGPEVQGSLGGVLSTLDLGDWEVVKL